MKVPLRFDLTPHQSQVFESQARFKCLIAGRRFGKTFLACVVLIMEALRAPKRNVWYVGPSYRMVKDLAWVMLKAMIPGAILSRDPLEQALTILLKNGSRITLKGGGKPDALRGPGIDYLVMDEYTYCLSGLWEPILSPMLSVSEGGALFIGTPAGFNWGYDLWHAAHREPGWEAWQFTTAAGGWVSWAELMRAKRAMHPRIFRQEFLASFEALIGRVYEMFHRHRHVSDAALDDTDQPLYVGMDFNVNPMSAVLANVLGSEGDQLVRVFDEVVLPVSTTAEIAAEIRRRYPERHIIVCPDASGKSRTANADHSSFQVLEQFGMEVRAPKANPRVVDRVNGTNSMLRNAAGQVRMIINPKCEHLIKGFEGLTYREGTNQPDKRSGLDHVTDAAGYLVWSAANPFDRQTRWMQSRFAIAA